MDKLTQLQKIIDEANRIVFFTGAGISTESGIPDFRSNNGLFAMNKKAEEIVSHSFFIRHTKEFYDFYKEKMIFPDAQPNPAHLKIAQLEEKKKVCVITQNIDGLHQKAGSTNVVELHGSVLRNYCQKCHKFYGVSKIIESEAVPYCDCKGIIKPDVVLYEEALNSEDITKAILEISNADTLIICGTSLAVYPAASFISYFAGNNLVVINKDSTFADNNADLVIHDSLAKVLDALN